MTKKLAEYAQLDTPQAVNVPPTAAGVATWALGKFGAGALIALAAVWWTLRIDDRAAAREDQLLDAYRQQATINQDISSTLATMNRRLDSQQRALEDIFREFLRREYEQGAWQAPRAPAEN